MTDLVAHFLIFSIVGVGALLAPLLLGALVRPKNPNPEKDAVYECGEPTIGTSYIQFDLRFYTVALLFIIFDVEVVFFFPWASVYGTATQLADTRLAEGSADRLALSGRLLDLPATAVNEVSPQAALNLAWTGLFDVLVFFGVLLVGFAYVWKRGDLDWVRAVTTSMRTARPPASLNSSAPQETPAALSL
ncbi:MAG: NADH-quinone oxidoreductase subunit A [Planctomycetaceae bacterium]|nr:NADH-quinone oxidoreductase subunit A [Planctomycetaceae bacterium]